MKILKYLFFLLLIVIIAGSIYIATKDGNYQIEETKVITAPVEMVFQEVNELKNWENWEPWSTATNDMIIEYGAKTSGDSASYSWKSESAGNGEIKTISAKPFSEIEQELIFKTPFGESTSQTYWEFNEIKNGTEVTWGIKGHQSFMEKLAFIFQEQSITEMMRPKFQEGLNNMESVILNKMDKYTISVDGVIQHGGGYYMYTTTASKISQVDEKMASMFTEVSTYMDENEIEKNGNPFVLYNEWNETSGTAIFSAGIFTPSEVITPATSEILTGLMPNQKVLKTTLKGDYKNLKEAWDTAYNYIETNDLEIAENANNFEVHLTSPEDVANPAKWITHLYIPIK
ncbi:effector-binding domain-containing protein [Salegentibacter holothuriorum]|uniref:Effector-binding domain-containing protein n=1 Tax=Salegentibacter holothuriorum TaxID=241145 RepID=A0A1T5D2X1_9FLAO|nr:GyrI-like domain-containing protein [Salegentibacter holothuriorum]SKB66052.1 effector-binding domain-containing protein [Salegentibacter holothuriorum]